ncbi:putative TIM-barrel fold metal-dependent hydrolase [Microbacterium ginsengiterrae]|uniref:Putative TIM-barrel fold metal-dependent hydrolase n=1 Tax=Microbacterium ginsengiterrae TaxID=546115 RepID=A0A7W9CCN9_9MICO|nr:amidohydrolase family protein [Microbacterium ginsengiterrae]MBB5743167.1 putative TIM-barrel fold metal-dependent hydrolase [Microbacterium ginsengiterrae]
MTAARTAMRVEDLVAVDMHVHVEADDHGHFALDQELLDASAAYFRSGSDRTPTIDRIAAKYRELRMAAVVFTVDATSALGQPALSSAEIADACHANADVLIPFGSVDPNLGAAAVETARALIEDHGVRGFKFHPSLQNFDPSDRAHWPLYDLLARHGMIALFHTGQTGIGAGLDGGRGIRLRLSEPMLVDDVAAAFPALRIILAHPSVPWMDQSLAMATHKANVFIDLSGWSPKYFPPQLVRQAGSLLKRKVLFGSDFPLIDPTRWLTDFERLDIPEESRSLIIRDNAIALLGLNGQDGR